MAAAMEVLRKAVRSLVLFLFLFVLSGQASIPGKCKLGKGANTYMITNWTWKVVNGMSAYYINICEKQQKVSSPGSECSDSSVCSTNVDNMNTNVQSLGLTSTRRFNVTRDGTGFTVQYDGKSCRKGSNVKWSTKILVLCGKLLGAPEYIEESVSSKGCEILFEFVTNEACKKQPKEVEIPCSLYNSRHQLIDLSPLIKLQGGYEVSTANSQFGFHINVCRGITAEKDGHTHGCPTNSSMCRINKNLLQRKEDVGSITMASNLILTSKNEVILHYNTSKKADGCPGNPVTKITFVCPQDFHQSGERGPKLTADRQCHYEVLWETEFACPQSNLMATSGCVLSNEFVDFDLSKLSVEHGNYMANNTVSEKSGKTSYVYYINVCKSTGFPCAGINSTVCQEEQDGKVKRSLGDISTQKLRYADGQLILTYQGGTPCSSGIKRSTVITFKCDYHSDKGEPVFSYEDYCLYFFDWKTKYACPPSRRTGTRCRVQSESGIRYDLSELVRLKAPNWIALDGESSSSDRSIYINVCGQLHLSTETEKCDRAAAVCMVTKSTGKVISLGRYTDPPSLNPDRSIKLVYTNGGECRKDTEGKSVFITSDITFVCHPGDLESPPVLVSHSQDYCHYQFMWKSAAACSLGVNIGQNCKVQDKDAGYVFDLGPLAKKIWNKTQDFFTITNQDYIFQLKICGGSNRTVCESSNNVGACQINNATHWKIGEANSLLYYYDGMINLTYANGDQCHNKVNRTTHITFLCDPNATDSGLGVPQYEKENHCVYNFRWFTKYACPAKVSECVATYNTDQYDLTSLVRTQDNWEDSSSDLGTFYINVCRSLNLSPAVSGCSGTAAVCLKSNGSIPVNLGEVTDGPVVQAKDIIVITYRNGDKCGEKQHYKTNIAFQCDAGETSSGPIYDGKGDNGCTYKFRWKTAAACTIKNVEGSRCAVKDPKSDTLFNLHPLTRKQNEKPYNVSDGKGGMFVLNICGNVADCNGEENAGACQFESGGKKILLGEKTMKLRYEGEILTLSYENGYNYVAPGSGSGRNREVHIKFYCNPKIPLGEPAFIEQEDQKYFFDFQTSLACASSAVQCLVTVNRKTYDLSPLGLTVGNWEAVDSRSQNKHLHYYINVCRAVNPTSDLIRCPGGPIGACQIDHKSGKGFNMGYIQSNPTVSSSGELTLQYLGGSGCHGQFNRSTRIIFSCAKSMGSPIFVGETPECEYIFTWETPSACVLTQEHGTHCKVEDKQYFYMFDMSKLYNETQDYNISVSGSPGEWIVLNICKNIKASNLCTGKNAGACIHQDKNVCVDVNSNLSYYNGQINMTYRSAGATQSTVLNIIFECLNTTKSVPRCVKIDDTHYVCRWPTLYACRPLNHVQCSIRSEDGSVDKQYDFSSLSLSSTNWQAKTSQPHFKAPVSYFINVCRSIILTGFAASCPPTAGVCMVTKDNRYVNLGTLTSGPVKDRSSIFLVYKDGDKCSNGKKYSTRIQMECGSTEGVPMYVTMSEQTCVYDFLWITSTACPLNTMNETVFDNCTAINPQTRVVFDLKPLKKYSSNYLVLDEERRKYFLNVCGPVNKPPKGCSTSSGVCQVGSNTYNAGNANSRLHFDNGILYLNYSGGDYCHHVKKRRETIISFVCNSSHVNKEYYGKPVFIAETADCTYHIMWHTQLVCERQFECAAFQKDDNGYTMKYSLSRLMKTDVNWVVTSLTGDTYYINLCRPLVPIPNVLCPAGSWACRVLKGGTIQGLGQANKPATVDNNGVLVLVYKSNIACRVGGSVELHFTLTCAHGSLGNPVLETIAPDSCIVHVSWATSAACPDIQKPDPEHCRVFDNATAKYYDLSPLKNTSLGNSFFTVETDIDNLKFYVSVCGGMELKGDNPCDKAGVCRISKGTYTPLGVFSNWNMTFYRDERMMIIKYCNDTCDKAKISSQIIFICDEKSGLGNPKLETNGIDGADFVWRTSLVCPPVEEECVFEEGSNSYDLQLLSSRTNSWHYVTEQGKSRYWINLCRGIRDGPTGCPPTASVCLKTKSSKAAVLGFTSTQRITMTSDGFLLVRYSGMAPVEKCLKHTEPTVTFHFECGSHVGQPTLVASSSSWSACSFIFKWKSKVACKVEKEPLSETNCVVKNPVTEETVDFSRLNSTKSITGKDESNKQVKYVYFMNICGSLGKDESLPSKCRSQEVRGICFNGKFLPIKTWNFNYEGFMFSLWLTTKETCPGKSSKKVIVINFLCSVDELGSPKFEYVSSNCHHVFSWPTSVVCTGDLSHLVTDPSVLHKAVKSTTKNSVGIAFGVVAFVVLIVLLGFVLYKPSRRHSLVSCVRWNFKKHILRKEIKYPVYRYEKLIAGDEDEADALLKEAEGSDEENDDDDDLLAF